MEELKNLVAARGYQKAAITRTLNFTTEGELSKASCETLQARRGRLLKALDDYDSLNIKISSMDSNDKEPVQEVEQNFFKALAAIDKALHNVVGAGTAGESPKTTKMKLPPIHITPFDGKFTDYVPFINLFMSMIDNDKSLDKVQKLYYLRSFVRDEPYALIKNLPITEASYSEALSILNDRYNNKFKIVSSHINNILDCKCVVRSTASGLREFVSVARQEVAAIKNHEPDVKYWDVILLCILSRKLDAYTSKAFQLDRDFDAPANLEDFLKYLEHRALALENAEQPQSNARISAHITTTQAQPNCSYCKYDHKLYTCKTFQMLTATDRIKFITESKRCTICLGAHTGKCKYHFRCSECRGPHNSLLHCKEPAPPVTLTGNISNNVLLPTVRIKVHGRDGTEFHVKALLDSGSQVSLVTSSLVQQLGLTPNPSNTNIIGIANAKSNTKYCIPLEIHSLKTPFRTELTCHVVDQITCQLPQNKIDISRFVIPPNITLSDDQFYVPSEIHVLIAADVFFQTLLPSQKPLKVVELPVSYDSAQHCLPQHSSPQLFIFDTYFGHIIGGNLPQKFTSSTCNKVSLKCEISLNETLAQFWTNEKVPEIFSEQTSEQELCEQIFQSSIQLNNNQFQVALPLKIPLSEISDALGESFHLALKRFYNLEKRLHANPDLHMQYKNFIHEYLELNHGHYVDIESYNLGKEPAYFLPHHAVINENSKTTKLRTVFDGSMKTNKKISLNDLQLNGSVVQRDLFDIILLFRLGKYTFTTDIKRMFRNIRIDPKYTSLQNILWRDTPADIVKCIRLDTVTYGLKSSNYLATRCLDELANRFEKLYPIASSVIKNNAYVDDIIFSSNNLDTTITAKHQICKLLELGSFHTHKWSSNDKRILSDIPPNEQNVDSLDLQKDNDYHIKALGLQVNIKSDQFIISSPEPFKAEKITKRNILSYIGRFYDPMGFASPIVVTAKAIMQRLWVLNIDWNDIPPLNVRNEWLQFTADLAAMDAIHLTRNISFSESDTAELIGFADASSTTGYGCCVYLRLTDITGTTNVHLLCSKSRINPIQKKGMTVPRLELNAALLLSKLIVRTHETLKLKINIVNVYLFSDSQIVLAWLNTEITKLQAYVGNRVSVIHQNTGKWNWLYVNTHENPADLISRGVKPSELSGSDLWWFGPQFLHNSNYKFAYCETNIPLDLPEVKSCLVLSGSMVCQDPPALEYVFERLKNYSDIRKIVRLLAYILRFLNNMSTKTEKICTKFLQHTELDHSLMLMIRHEQCIYYKAEIDAIRRGNNLKGNLANLHPFLDELGILRVGGRLHHADICFSQKHPVILPRDSQITGLLIRAEHERLLHAGPKLLLSSLNQKFWIVNGLLAIKKITHKCIICFRQKATVAKQLMGSLPAGRVTASRPFEKVGVDFAGPIEVKLSRVRKSVIGKGYICVFVCFTTKAVHLELASDLTTDTFLACLKRFIARRGLPREIHCDNASTFRCAGSQLAELYKLLASQSHQNRVFEFTSELAIEFHYIPGYSPTFGGLWEAAVKSTKYHLKRILQKNVLTYEQLYTVLIEIEAVLNSRPLLPLSSDPNDYCYLTPGHFLIGTSLTMYPEKDISDIPGNRLKFWKLCTNFKQRFWKVWHKYYLNVLQNRPKWLYAKDNVQVGSLVILKQDNTPSMSWPMARIVTVFPGHDGKVRTVEVRLPNNKTHVRAINKIAVLPLQD